MSQPPDDTGSVAAVLNPFSEMFVSDPYASFELARNAGPVAYLSELDIWAVTTHKAVKYVLDNPLVFSNANTTIPLQDPCPEASKILEDANYRRKSLFSTDPPEHTKWRKIARPIVAPRRVRQTEDFVRDLTRSTLQRIKPLHRADLVKEVFVPIPALTILQILGFDPESEAAKVIGSGASHYIEFTWGYPDGERQQELATGSVQWWNFARELVLERQVHPRDDVTSDLLGLTNDDGEKQLTVDEVASLLLTFFSAGHETTASGLGNAVYQLLREQSRWEMLLKNPEMVPEAVEELLRLDTSTFAFRKRATRDTTIEGVTIPEGAHVLVLLGSANHDDAVFTNPQEFDPHRENMHNNMVFGRGIHYCIGAPLARVEMKVVLTELLTVLPTLRLQKDDPIQYLPNLIMRAPTQLHVEWE